MRRRDLISLIGGATVAWPFAASPQQPATQRLIAIFHPAIPTTLLTETGGGSAWRAFFAELRRLGYVEGANLIIERYFAEGHHERKLDQLEVLGYLDPNDRGERAPMSARRSRHDIPSCEGDTIELVEHRLVEALTDAIVAGLQKPSAGVGVPSAMPAAGTSSSSPLGEMEPVTTDASPARASEIAGWFLVNLWLWLQGTSMVRRASVNSFRREAVKRIVPSGR